MKNTIKDWALATATVVGVVEGVISFDSVRLEATFDDVPSVRRRGPVTVRTTTQGRTEVSVNVTYGPVLGNSPSDLRRWMRNSLVKFGLFEVTVAVLAWQRRTITQRDEIIAACVDLHALVNNPDASATGREWASQRLTKLMEHHGVAEADLAPVAP